ncbi:putative beta-glucosidase 9 [Argentina anserina]|uniref:putative beta-glucosidase 9 n=1 Tax=Argentina anserina TaxID=57926 RepID=UPI00217640D4|nr:putative beta-glucosidase 9 [Potentilla anserina]
MATQGSWLLAIVLLLLGFVMRDGTASNTTTPPTQYDTAFLNRTSFPAGFIFGTASSSYHMKVLLKRVAEDQAYGITTPTNIQIVHSLCLKLMFIAEKIKDGSNGDIANDEYHRYKEDVGIMKNMGLDAYRFSISWSRLLPNLHCHDPKFRV